MFREDKEASGRPTAIWNAADITKLYVQSFNRRAIYCKKLCESRMLADVSNIRLTDQAGDRLSCMQFLISQISVLHTGCSHQSVHRFPTNFDRDNRQLKLPRPGDSQLCIRRGIEHSPDSLRS